MTTTIDTVHNRALAADRNQADLAWEHAQEHALHAFRSGNAAAARASWTKALEIAERHFERGDPRIAASLNNQAFALMRQDQLHQANKFFQLAMNAWEDSWRWIPLMTPSSGPNEDEVLPYDRQTQESFYALIRQGQTITETLWHEHCLPFVKDADWAAVKPKGMTDVRRLFAAIFLMPTAKERRDA